MNHFRWVSVLGGGLVALVTVAANPAIGNQEQPLTEAGSKAAKSSGANVRDLEHQLTSKALTKDDRKFLLNEGPAITRFNQTQQLYAEYEKALLKQAQFQEFDENLAGLNLQWQALQQQAATLQQQINSAGSVHPRMRAMVNAQLTSVRQQHSATQTQANQFKAQITSLLAKSPKPEDRKKAAADVERTGQSFFQSARQLETLVTPLLTKYHELALDPQVTDALTQLRHETTKNYKLGPSDELRAASKALKDLKLTPKRPVRSSSVARHF